MINVSFTGKIAVVTGAAQGIGKSIALSLAKRGAVVYCIDIKEDLNSDTAQQASLLSNSQCYAMYCDISKPLDIKKTFDYIVQKESTIDILINNAAVFSIISFVKDSYMEALEDYEFNNNVNSRGTFLCSKMVAPLMAKKGKGHIINVNTNHVKRNLYSVSKNEHSYDSSKYAQLSLTQSMAKELKDYGVRVNAICPAATRTPMLFDYFKSIGKPIAPVKNSKKDGIPSLLEPDDVAEAICGMLQWSDDEPVGKDYLVVNQSDCIKLANGHVEELSR